MSAGAERWWVLLSLCCVLFTALGVIASTHACRGLYTQLQDLEARRWYLEEEYSRLLLEQSTWASHHRIESQASEALGLQVPPLARTRLLER